MAGIAGVKINDSFFEKTDHNKWSKILDQALTKWILKAESMCRDETYTPRRYGVLINSHAVDLSQKLKKQITNNAGYFTYVAYGTRFMAPRNYPKQIINILQNQHYFENCLKESMGENNVK